MKGKYKDKILKYTKSDNSSKLKHLVKKHSLDLSTLLFDDQSTLLHVACVHEAECVMRYCLREGLDPLLVNGRGQLPLHVASQHAMKARNSHIYTDMILPLIKRAPGSLDHKDNHGVTPRQLLEDVKARMAENLTSSSDSSSGESEARSPTPDWNDKLADAFEEEQQQFCGRYTSTDYHAEEKKQNHEDWFSDVMDERQRKRHYSRIPHTKSKSKSKSEPSPKRPKTGLSDEAKRQFEENLKREYEKEQKHRKDLSDREALNMKKHYEEQCQMIFSSDVTQKLSYRAIPWPHKPRGSVEDIEEFLFVGLTSGSDEYKKELKAQRVRWHPDRFVQKVGQHLKETDRERILEKVKQISQLLNSISD